MRGRGLTRLELGLSVAGSLALLVIAGSAGALAAVAILVAFLSALGLAATAFGADTRDGGNW